MRRRAAARLAGLLVWLLGGCAGLPAPFSEHLRSDSPAVRACADWYRSLDERTAAAGVQDAQDTRVPGFPYLRVSRLLDALRPLAADDASALQALADHMLRLDLDARRYEMRNLPAGEDGLRAAQQRTQECGLLLRDTDLASAPARATLLERARVPDDYDTASRFFGVYALSRVPFAAGVRRYEDDMRAAFRRELSSEGVLRYAPAPASVPLPRARAALILQRSAQNPLGIPEPQAPELDELLLAHAPSFEIEVKADYDRFGALRLQDAAAPAVDGSRLTAYAQAAWTRYRGRVLLQLVYTIWFSERPPQSVGDLLAGKLDGLVWRVTLSPDGEPLLYDSIHACGCYHQFFPTPRASPLPAPDAQEEWAFAPQSLPRMAEGERPLVRVASGTHYIERVSAVQGTDSLARYEIRPYDGLRSMFRAAGGFASLFRADGMVAGTERGERYLFWPMGIASAGAMRQWGRHATAFVGRRHFDDADLLEKRFALDLP
jgi:hypothetical protein